MDLGIPILLFAAGVMLVLLELFVPSFGLLTVGAVVCFALSVWQAYKPEHPGAAVVIAILAPAVTLCILCFGLKYVPRMSWGRGLVLRHPSGDGAQERPTASETVSLPPSGGTAEDEMRPLVGKQGVAQSQLRPAGVALIDGGRVDVVTEGGMIDAGARVKVIAVEGNRVIVRRVQV